MLQNSMLIIFSARTNIAVGKQSNQSSPNWNRISIYGPQKANDGKTYAVLDGINDTCSVTKLNTLPYWYQYIQQTRLLW